MFLLEVNLHELADGETAGRGTPEVIQPTQVQNLTDMFISHIHTHGTLNGCTHTYVCMYVHMYIFTHRHTCTHAHTHIHNTSKTTKYCAMELA